MLKKKILKAYESLAEDYNAQIDHKPHNAYYDRPNTLKLLEDVRGKNILDAACGPGKYAELLLKEGAQVKGFDLSPKMIDLAQKRNSNTLDFFVHDLERPMKMFKDGTFDIVLCALAMHYVRDWNLTIQEFYRVLKPKGKVVMSIEHPFFEYTYFKSEKYFEVEPVKCLWKSFGQPVEVNSYRRPLFEIIHPFTENGFFIEKLVEPKPVAEFEKLDPKHFKELNEFPAFMALRAVKGR